MPTSNSSPSCSTCIGSGRAEKWKSFDHRSSLRTSFNTLRTNAANCLLCAAIWQGIQQFPRGRELIRQSKPLHLHLHTYGGGDTFRVRYDITPPGPSQIEYQFDLILFPETVGSPRPTISPAPNYRQCHFDDQVIDGVLPGLSYRERHPHDIKELSAIPLRPPVSLAPISVDTLASVMAQISDCTTKHKHSREPGPTFKPDRLVDVGPPDGSSDPKLVDGASHINGPYLALSHCWGGTMPFKTIKANKAELCQKIEFSRLSRNIQDAVTVTRWLKHRYVWIDSFCIIQDDSQDWLEQASKMASIYAGAYITICATRSASFTEGFLLNRISDVKLSLADRLPPGMAIYARDCNKLEDAHNSVTGSFPSGKSPLFQRAWCFQERLLAQRALHFMDSELILECEEDLRCECNEQDSFTSLPEKQLYSKRLRGTPNILWETLVEKYTSREMTFARDVFPAISAVARDCKIKPYIAGLIMEVIDSNLLWKAIVRKSLDGSTTTLPKRPDTYTAPSFSWASVIGPVVYDHPQGASFEPMSELEDWYVTLENPSDPYSRVLHGVIVLRGSVLEATMGPRPRVVDDQIKGDIYHADGKVTANFDTEDAPPPGTSLRCITICIQTSWYNLHNGLVLKTSSKEKNFFERVGCYWDAKANFFKDAKEELIIIC